MPTNRRYSKAQKAQAVALAEATSTEAAAETLGYPRKTLAYWMGHPEFAELRRKSQEERAEGWRMIEGLAQARLIELVPTMDAREAIVAGGVAAEKAQLLGGHATDRIETHDWKFDDHETVERAAAVVVEELARRTDESAAQAAVGAPAETGTDTPTG
jgi:transposase-like protein